MYEDIYIHLDIHINDIYIDVYMYNIFTDGNTI